ncbi:MAG: NUDIX domain-containing protein [Candidatus Aenigmarchaeota archaeon]|nr:NUDIX domain-containing protein [Candidatus Aenigmarchaeota archaeon]
MIAVVGIVENNGRILVGKKVSGNSFLAGKWHIPGGKVLPGETDEIALKREMKEECGIDVSVGRFLDEFYEPVADMRAKWFLCSCDDDKLKPGGDLADAKWVDKKDAMEICDKDAIARWPRKIKRFFG